MATRFDPTLYRVTPPAPEEPVCDACDRRIEGEPGGRGYYVWARGEEVRRETPPLCASCAQAIGIAALAMWELEEDGD